MPFYVRAIQSLPRTRYGVAGGSEFAAEFEQECGRRRIRLFVLSPRSPKLNGHVERAQRTHTEAVPMRHATETYRSASEPCSVSVGAGLQHRAATSVPGLPTPHEYLSRTAEARGQCVRHVPNEYTSLIDDTLRRRISPWRGQMAWTACRPQGVAVASIPTPVLGEVDAFFPPCHEDALPVAAGLSSQGRNGGLSATDLCRGALSKVVAMASQ